MNERPAFPWHQSPGNQNNLGLTAQQYAAIHLMVPNSGDPTLDAMIGQARDRRESLALMCAAVSGITRQEGWPKGHESKMVALAMGIATEASKAMRGEE